MTGSGHLGDALSGLLDGEIAPAARREAEAHLVVCGECRAELALVADARSAVRALPVRPLPGRWEPLVESGPPPAGRPARRAAWAAVAAAAAVVALLLPHQHNVDPELTQRVDSHVARASVDSDPLSTLAPIAVPVSFRR